MTLICGRVTVFCELSCANAVCEATSTTEAVAPTASGIVLRHSDTPAPRTYALAGSEAPRTAAGNNDNAQR
jgi:hypothetical protein